MDSKNTAATPPVTISMHRVRRESLPGGSGAAVCSGDDARRRRTANIPRIGCIGPDQRVADREPAADDAPSVSGASAGIHRRYFRWKYAGERVLAAVLMMTLAPLFVVVYVMIRATSRGGAIYSQRRMGRDQKTFTVYKFRTMVVDAEKQGAVWCREGDDRITPLGRWLRTLHIDEWPQLFNVLRGDMTLTGPRPERPEIAERLADQIAGYHDRTMVKPGLTGLAQVNLKPDQTIDDVRRKQIFDLYYIRHAGPSIDARLLIATGLRMFGVQGETVMRLMRLCRRELLLRENLLDETRMDHGRIVPWVLRNSTGRPMDPPTLGLLPSGLLPSSFLPSSFLPSRLLSPSVSRRGGRGGSGASSRESFNHRGIHIDPPGDARPTESTIDSVANAMTIDVEDYYQVTAFEGRVTRDDWRRLESRVEANTDRMLQLMDQCGVRGTFFVLGWVADRYPDLICRIAAGGHEIATHGYWHRLNYNIDADEFARDLSDSIDAIGSAGGQNVVAYRAPSFSIVDRSLWALQVLAEHGITRDTSLFPIDGHDRYGIAGARRDMHRIDTPSGSILEFPPSIGQVLGRSIPIGGGYFRLLPYHFTDAAIQSERAAGRPAMFYVHPWEIDPQQPRMTGTPIKTRVRHYVGLDRTHRRLRRLMQTHRFDSMAAVIEQYQSATSNVLDASPDQTDGPIILPMRPQTVATATKRSAAA